MIWALDYAVVNVFCDKGARTGWYSLTSEGKPHMKARIAGYPGNKPGNSMYAAYGGLYRSINGETWRYTIDMTGGQSGAPIVLTDSVTPASLRGKVAGINNYSVLFLGLKENQGVKMTSKRVGLLWEWAGKNGH